MRDTFLKHITADDQRNILYDIIEHNDKNPVIGPR
jgi:hypothetical protein